MYLARRAWVHVWDDATFVQRAAPFMEAARRDIPELDPDVVRFGVLMRQAVAGGALLHDVGHPPFSHALERQFGLLALRLAVEDGIEFGDQSEWQALERGEEVFHEHAGRLITRQICDDALDDDEIHHLALKRSIAAILGSDPNGRTWASALHGIIAGEVDVDRLDYVMRDSYRAGTEFGSIDWQRLVDALELHVHTSLGEPDFRIAPSVRARSAVETLLVHRLQSYQWADFHPRVVGFTVALRRAFELYEEMSRPTESDRDSPLIGTMLATTRPNLVYWSPRADDISAALGGRGKRSGIDGDRTELGVEASGRRFDESEIESSLARNHERCTEVQAGVGDATVREALARSYLTASGELTGHAGVTGSRPKSERSAQLATYARAWLFRRKNFVPAWKTAEEYSEAARHMQPALAEAMDGMLEQYSDGVQTPERQVMVEFVRDLRQRLKGDAVVGVNAIVDAVLAKPSVLDALVRDLNKADVEAPGGFWGSAYQATVCEKRRRMQ